jgi:2',3'-cyclic-nucleotide 2'-phosphodiesterase (5'-nucleotidase family)
MRQFRQLVLNLFMALLVAIPNGLAFAEPVPLTILHTNDTHDHLEPFMNRDKQEVGGVARRASYFKSVRDKHPNVLILDAGDVFQGTPIFTFFGGQADFKTMNQAGYDVIAVGNHDLDNGVEHLVEQSRLLSRQPVCANLVDRHKRLIFPAYRMVERGGLQVAIIGVLGRDAYEAVAVERRAGTALLDPVATLKTMIPILRTGADLIIVVSHSGLEEDVAMAKAVSGIDLVVGGHSHTRVEQPVAVRHGDRETLVVQAYRWGEVVGKLDLDIENKRIVRHRGALMPITGAIAPDAEVAKTVAHYSDQIRKIMAEVVGHSTVEFTHRGREKGDSALANLVADAIQAQSGADIAVINTDGIRSDLVKGDITRGTVISMLPFDNRMVTLEASDQQIRAVVNYASSRLNRGGSIQFAGLHYALRDGVVTDIQVAGMPLKPGRRYTIATVDYVANGNDGADVFRSLKPLKKSEDLVRDVFIRHLATHSPLTMPEGGRVAHPEAVTR